MFWLVLRWVDSPSACDFAAAPLTTVTLVEYLGKGAIVGGSTLFETGLLDEINRRASAEEPLESHHIEWLRADLVTTVGGFLAEEQLLGDIADSSGRGDTVDAAKAAALLGFKEDSDDGASRLQDAVRYWEENGHIDPRLEIEQLRGCLFFECRRYRHFGHAPGIQDVPYIRQLVHSIRDAVRGR
jgi:hypothetical protein